MFVPVSVILTHVGYQQPVCARACFNFGIACSQFVLIGFLICVGLTLSALPKSALAASSATTPQVANTYHIPAGDLVDALNKFSEQSGVYLLFDTNSLGGLTTKGLKGRYHNQEALDQLLADSMLQATALGSGFSISPASAVSAPEMVITTLPAIQVTASNVARYTAVSSVTATKTDTLLRDVPQAISVITQDLIKDQAIQSIGDAVRYVPGVGVSSGEGNRDALIFRGNRSTGDFFMDGMRDDAAFFRDLYNIERIEVLKGANGMIFGRGGSGGVVNRVSKQAGWDPIREFSFRGGSFNQKRMTLDVGQGLNDKVAFRVNAMYEDADSFRGGVSSRRQGISPTITIKPTNRTKIVLNMERFHDKRTADRGIPSFNGAPVNVRRSQFFGDPKRSNAEVDVLSFNAFFEHKFDIGVTVNNRTTYANYDKFYQNVFANGRVSSSDMVSLSAYNNTTDRENVFNQTNLLYSLQTGSISHTLLAGIEVGQQITDDRRRTGFFNNERERDNSPSPFSVPLSNSITQVPITFETRSEDAHNHSVMNITSLYIQDQIEFMPQLQAVLGVRHDSINTDFVKKSGSGNELNTSDSLISPRFGLIYKPIEPVSIYTSYSRAYVPRAGDQLTSLKVTTASLKPEKFTTLEVGIKWDIRPDLAVTAAVYRLDRTNVITTVPGDSSKSFLSKGQRTKGVELSVSGQLTPKWSVMGGYAFQDGELTSTSNGGAKKGATVAELPRNTFSMWSRYNFTPKFGAGLGVINRSDMFASTDNTVRVQGFTRVDAALYTQFTKRIRGQVNIENLFNTKYIAFVHSNNNLTPGSPFAVRATLVVNF